MKCLFPTNDNDDDFVVFVFVCPFDFLSYGTDFLLMIYLIHNETRQQREKEKKPKKKIIRIIVPKFDVDISSIELLLV